MLIVGAGFGGLQVARGLAGALVDVTIVDRHNHQTFPLIRNRRFAMRSVGGSGQSEGGGDEQ